MELADYLKSFIGIPYKYGSKVPQKGGIDCSGLVIEGLRSIGKWDLSIANSQMLHDGLSVKHRAVQTLIPEKNDILFFGKDENSIKHISVAISGSQMVEAGGDDETGMVRIRPISWRRDLIKVIRL